MVPKRAQHGPKTTLGRPKDAGRNCELLVPSKGRTIRADVDKLAVATRDLPSYGCRRGWGVGGAWALGRRDLASGSGCLTTAFAYDYSLHEVEPK